MTAAPAAPRTFRCPSIDTRRAGLARLLARISVTLMLAPVVLVYVVAVAAKPFGLAVLGPSSIDAAVSSFVFGTLGAVIFAAASWVAGGQSSGGDVELVVTERALSIGRPSRVDVIERRRIVSGIVLSMRPAVELRLHDGRVLRVQMTDQHEAEALLDALALGPDRRRVVVTLGSERRPLVVGCLVYPAAMMLLPAILLYFDPFVRRLLPVLIALAVAATTLAARRLSRPREVVVGADGVHVRGWSGGFIRFAEIAHAGANARALVLQLRPDADIARREPVRLLCPDEQTARGLAARIRDAMALSRGGAARRAAVTDALDPGDRPLPAWRDALAKIMRSEEQYRTSAVTKDEVLAVLEDAAAPSRLRIGAALALRETSDTDARQKIRIAAETCADADLREALEAAAEDELDERTIRKTLR